MSIPSTLMKHGVRPNQLPKTHRRWSLKLWNSRNHSDMHSSEAVSSTKDVADSSGFELTLQASPSSSLTAIDSQDHHSPRRSITQSSSSLAAPFHDEIDTCDKDHVSVSSCSHVARSEPDVVEWEVTTVASSPNPLPASVEIGEQVISRHAISNRDDPSCSRTSASPGVGNDNSDAASTIPHIVVSGDASPRVAEPSLPAHILCDVHILPSSPTSGATIREATSQVVESRETVVLPQGGTPESMGDWSNDEKEFIESLPSGIGHYDRKTLIDEFTRAEFTVPAMLTDFNTYISPQTDEEEVLPVGWTKHTHSDGKPYFYHGHDRIITEEWLYDIEIAEKVARYISMLKNAISKRAELFGRLKSWHLYVEITEYGQPSWEGDTRFRCRYYFVNHDVEGIFWLSKCILDKYLSELRGKMSRDLIRRYLQREYWNHHYYFSDLHQLTNAQWKSIKKSILLAKIDVTTSDTSTVTMSIDKLKIMSKTIIVAESKTSHFINSVAINRAFTSELDASEAAGKPAACMMALLRDQIFNYHGQRDARTDRDDSVYGYGFHNEKRTVPFRTMNLLLFYAPIKHYTALNKVWVDRLISKGPWQRLIEQITAKWQQHIVLATVLLAVNMAFLAIPSVDEMGAGQQHCFVTQILCYLSVASSMATIILGLILTSHHNSLKHADVAAVTKFLERHWQRDIGFERLSIMYSTPYALLMWR
ncbi:hypothetical protein IW262DRAFT_1535873 [Armillaria fumosa]|nr:hypothetical protein IW262DRAFT_1535873 [Armillaria fumosa]